MTNPSRSPATVDETPSQSALDEWIAREPIAFSLDSSGKFAAAVDAVMAALGRPEELDLLRADLPVFHRFRLAGRSGFTLIGWRGFPAIPTSSARYPQPDAFLTQQSPPWPAQWAPRVPFGLRRRTAGIGLSLDARAMRPVPGGPFGVFLRRNQRSETQSGIITTRTTGEITIDKGLEVCYTGTIVLEVVP